ncbi:helix-turn-helix domain-containing protein [Flavobacterium caeni]|uniref:Helix-turn-helix domain-containing protein n=1 Tax=Flavobacterium caeni TaxID=490189 RepID=A0A1G5JJK7_9FLAO|nr:helix-turn-helix domain-containing protein [Flavobacterium caeni]SCY87908.1 Helix-turn-helix domain-containing protein [Flavobacterium caeni]
MKPKSSLRQQLGVTQREMSMLLGVTVSRWSMYESGLRELPGHTLPRLAQLIAAVQSPDAKPANVTVTDRQKHQLDQWARENDYGRQAIARQIAVYDKKSDAAARKEKVQRFLSTYQPAKDELPMAVKRLPKGRQPDAVQASLERLALERRAALLEFERKWLHDKMAGLG